MPFAGAAKGAIPGSDQVGNAGGILEAALTILQTCHDDLLSSLIELPAPNRRKIDAFFSMLPALVPSSVSRKYFFLLELEG
jgi:hypothetical protein